jgi:hypothetical protein
MLTRGFFRTVGERRLDARLPCLVDPKLGPTSSAPLQNQRVKPTRAEKRAVERRRKARSESAPEVALTCDPRLIWGGPARDRNEGQGTPKRKRVGSYVVVSVPAGNATSS